MVIEVRGSFGIGVRQINGDKGVRNYEDGGERKLWRN